jgi:hypothetical protein
LADKAAGRGARLGKDLFAVFSSRGRWQNTTQVAGFARVMLQRTSFPSSYAFMSKSGGGTGWPAFFFLFVFFLFRRGYASKGVFSAMIFVDHCVHV